MTSQDQKIDVSALLRSLYIDAKLSPRGEWWAVCPTGTHEDRTPSWSIKDNPSSPKHGYHKCFGCGFGGGPIDLVREIIGIEYSSAKHWLQNIESYSVPVLRVSWQVAAPVIKKFKLPVGVIQKPLNEWITPPKQYVLSRGIASQIDLFGLGYAVTGKCDGRIVIPVYNAKNELISYTARSYVDHPKRYLEPDTSEQADKNAIFGEHMWNDPNRMRGIVAITEGALNGLSVRVLFPNLSIASLMGSDISPVHIMKLTSNFHSALIMTDNDYAGDIAAEKLYCSLARTMNLIRITPSAQSDWNDYLRNDPESMKWQVNQSLISLNQLSCAKGCHRLNYGFNLKTIVKK